MKLEEKDIQAAMNRRLSALADDPLRRAMIRQRIAQWEEPRKMKKLSVGLILALVLTLMTVTALAAGLIFSPKADALSLADQAMEKTYGIDQSMLGYFRRTAQEQSGGVTVVTYEGCETLSYVLGTYTVTVNGSKAEAVWSREGEDTSGGLDADAWGIDQLREMLRISTTQHEAKEYLAKAKAINEKHGLSLPPAAWTQLPPETEAEYAARMEKIKKDIQAVQKLSYEELSALARQALTMTYHLTEEQEKLLTSDRDMDVYAYVNGQPCLEVFFSLQQKPSPAPDEWPEWTEMDGQYYVSVNVETGVIEDVLYDSGLNGNG